jgi:choline dehydrogenase-like flavoprotein
MANISIDGRKTRTYDAIVVGSGISGGWAAKELTEAGLKTLVLERGRDVKHLVDYPTANKMPFEFPHRGEIPREKREANPILSRAGAWGEDSDHFFVKDDEHPYVQKKPFDWIRGYQVGGRSLLWARQTQRWSDYDFEGPARDGFAVDWPIRYRDIAPWYSHVEKFAGISGNKDGLPALPDGEFLPPNPLNAVEKHFARVVEEKFENRHLIAARFANLTKAGPEQRAQGRTRCLSRRLCRRGCPFGGYFSSNSSTLPWAERTGNLELRPHSVVHSILYDEKKGKASGVRVIDSNTKESTEYYSRIVFLNASALNTNLILLNSKSSRFPEGLGNDNGLLGKYIAFHNYNTGIRADFDGLKEFATFGQRPGSAYMPRFRNLFRQETDFLRGYATGFAAGRRLNRDTSGQGEELKEALRNPKLGNWYVSSHMMGETLPKESNSVRLHRTKTDEWGIPLLEVDIDYDDNDRKMELDALEQLSEMYEAAGFKNIRARHERKAPGLDIHEMGGVRMGRDPKTSLLNKWNQLHACKNVFVTDGACMTSTSTQNPSLTYMAITARAADWAVEELGKGNL